MSNGTSVRTSSRRADKLEPGDRLMVLGIQVATVQLVEPMVHTEPIGWRDLGRRGKEPIYWMQVHLKWERIGGPAFYIAIPGNKHVALRDTNPDPEHTPG